MARDLLNNYYREPLWLILEKPALCPGHFYFCGQAADPSPQLPSHHIPSISTTSRYLGRERRSSGSSQYPPLFDARLITTTDAGEKSFFAALQRLAVEEPVGAVTRMQEKFRSLPIANPHGPCENQEGQRITQRRKPRVISKNSIDDAAEFASVEA